MITLENIHTHELVGLETTITDSSNAQIIGLTGKIVDETKSMFTLDTKNGLKTIPKKQNAWKFFSNNEEFTLSGQLLEKRSHDRLVAKL